MALLEGFSIHMKRLDDYQTDPHNANRGTERGRGMLEQSIRKYGAGRSILVDRNGVAIAGNKTLEVAAELGLDVVEVETDGNQLVVVRRTDLDLSEAPARELAYADNRVAQVDLEFDPAVIAEDLRAGVDLSGMWVPGELASLIDPQLPDPSPPKEPHLGYDVLVTVECSREAFDRIKDTLAEWAEEDGLAVNIS